MVQHTLYERMLLMRRRMMRWALRDRGLGAYVPFIGDGDIVADMRWDRIWTVYGADLDAKRVATAQERLQGAVVRAADCDTWPFAGEQIEPIALADFDAWIEPYASFRAFWAEAPKADRLVLFFTDGRRKGAARSGSWTKPDGSKVALEGREKARVANTYLTKHVWPWFDDLVGLDAEWHLLERFRYMGAGMVMHSVAMERL